MLEFKNFIFEMFGYKQFIRYKSNINIPNFILFFRENKIKSEEFSTK